jgi:hypothetical protein
MEKTFITLFTVWAACVQTSPERFVAWIIATKLFEIAYRIFREPWTENWTRDQRPLRRSGARTSLCTRTGIQRD